jgi:hypothetical protein
MVLVELWHTEVQPDIPVPGVTFLDEMESGPTPELHATRIMAHSVTTDICTNIFISKKRHALMMA